MKIEHEKKTVVTNDNATIVIVNDQPIHIEVRRPADKTRKDDFADVRDIKFLSLHDIKIFILNCAEVFNHAVDEVGRADLTITIYK